MNALPSPDAQRLAKLLGMLGSAHDGEVIAAARQAEKLIRKHGATWPGILGISDAPPSPIIPHHADALEYLKASGLTDFERRFLRGIMAFQTLSASQARTLETIRVKIEMASTGC